MLLAFGVYQRTLKNELLATMQAGEVRLAETASRLRLQIDEFKALANFIASEPIMANALAPEKRVDVSANLADATLTYGAWQIDLFDRSGAIVATSADDQASPVSAKLLNAANNGRLGYELAVMGEQRLIRLSRGIRSSTGDPLGVVVVSANLNALEFEWPITPEPVVFFDESGFSFSSNRPNLLFLSKGEDPELTLFKLFQDGTVEGIKLWQFDPPDGPPYEVVVLDQFVTQLNLDGQIFLTTQSARRAAQTAAILTLAAASIIGLIGAILILQRQRLAAEAQHTATLEARVDARTAELRATQDELVEASKLSALGRLSAGISHELNQPLGAILNFAKNGRRLIERGNTRVAAENLDHITEQITRITRIIGNLRAFARQEIAPTERVDFAQTTRDALALMIEETVAAGVEVTTHIPRKFIPVMACQTCLEQVLVNILSNAVDAMADSETKKLALRLTVTIDTATLLIKDSGHGLRDTDRIFEPFYTTKDRGASKGLGLGLALSHGLITQFGGSLTCRNLDTGAEFSISLPILKGTDDS